MTRHVALLRGINVGTAKRIAMADLRRVFEGLGYTDVRTVLQSGNVVFDAPHLLDTEVSTQLQTAIADDTGVTSRVLVVPADRFLEIVRNNPFADAADPSRMLVTFLDSPLDESRVVRPSDDELAPERIVITREAVYQWIPDGLLQSRIILPSPTKSPVLATGRNLRTVTRIVALVSGPDDAVSPTVDV
jgi:uncharacterized protein (DUF1697 family)